MKYTYPHVKEKEEEIDDDEEEEEEEEEEEGEEEEGEEEMASINPAALMEPQVKSSILVNHNYLQFLYRKSTNDWSTLPEVSELRLDVGCGSVPSPDHTGRELVVAGSRWDATVDIYSFNTGQWRPGTLLHETIVLLLNPTGSLRRYQIALGKPLWPSETHLS